MAKALDLVGQRFHYLTVFSRAENSRTGKTQWNCRCDCGNLTTVNGTSLNRGYTKSCGCLHKEITTKHGNSTRGCKSTEYSSWHNMISRCTNPKHKQFYDYGGRGIKVCDRWRSSFENFLEDMGKKPTPRHSIDRIEVDGDYEPSNCKWSTYSEQNLNQRVRKTSKSGHRGVSWDKVNKKWLVKIFIGGRTIWLGRHSNLEDAVAIKKSYEQKYRKKSS